MSIKTVNWILCTLSTEKWYDPEAKKAYLLELQKLLTKEKTSKQPVIPFSMKQVMQRFDTKPSSNFSISELHKEINSLKEEIIQVKTRLSQIELKSLQNQEVQRPQESDFLRNKTVSRIDRLSNQIQFLKNDLKLKQIEQTLKTPGMIDKISQLQHTFESEVCSLFPNTFWNRKTHTIDLPYIDEFNEKLIYVR